MASAVAKRGNHRARRSASWSVMHSDEELARILQMQEEKEYQDHLAAKEVQCQSDHQLARLLSTYEGHHEGGRNPDEFQDARHPTRPPTTSRNASNSTGPAPRSQSQNATAISVTDSDDTDFSDCFEDTTFDDDLSTALERDRNAVDSLAERQDAADALIRNDEIAEALQNDEQLNRMGENGLELSLSIGEPGNASFNPIVVSPMSGASGVSVRSRSTLENEPMELSAVSFDVSNDGEWASENEASFAPDAASASTNSSLLMSVNIAWNAVGSAVNWVSELFSGAQPPQQSSASTRITTHAAGDAEEEEEDEEEGCEEDEDDDGWEDEDSDDFGDLDDDGDDDIDDDEVAAFDMMDSDIDDSDDDNVEPLIVFGGHDAVVVVRGRGLVQAEIDVLPTRTFQSRPPQVPTATSAAADAGGASEHQRQNECQVCLSNFADGEVLRTLPCCHLFHSECIDVWLQRNAICPVCRVRIRDEIGCR